MSTNQQLVTRRWLVALALASVALWFVTSSWFIRREFHAEVSCPHGISEISLRWTRSGVVAPHGVWIDPEAMDVDYLEIEPSGRATAGNGFEFWLYTVKDSAGKDIDLKGMIATAEGDTIRGEWVPFTQGPGVVYVGQSKGMLRIPIATREVRIEHAYTTTGGPVDFRFRGQSLVIDTTSEANRVGAITLPPAGGSSERVHVSQILPTYRTETLWLSWKGAKDSTVSVKDARLEFSVLGWRVGSRPMRCVARDGVAAGAGESAWKVEGDSPQLGLEGDGSPGVVLRLLGLAGTFAVLVLIRVACVLAVRAIGWFAGSTLRVQLLVAGVLIAANLCIALCTPVSVTSDGMDYINGAAGLAFKPHTLERIPLYKAPGLMFVLAGCMRLAKDFLVPFAILQAIFSLAMSALAYVMLKGRTGKGWATAAAFVIGVHPILMTYQQYLLRENLAAMLYLGVSALVVAKSSRWANGTPRRGLALAVAAGVMCGLGAYVRENFQILLLAVPVAIAVTARGSMARRGSLGAAALLAAGLTLTPYLAVKTWPQGVMGVVQGKAHANRALNVWNNQVTDGNDTAYLSRDQWTSFDREARAGRASDFDYVRAFRAGEPFLARENASTAVPSTKPGHMEVIMKDIADEAMARSPLLQARAVAISFLNQLGLWNFYWPPDAASGAWFSMSLRGQSAGFSTNYHVGTDWMVTNDLYTPYKDQLQGLVQRTARPVVEGKPTIWNHLFDEFFWFFRFLRPAIAVLFLVGVYRAVRRGDRALASVGIITIFMMAAAAAVVAPATDRFAAPFVPVLVSVACYTLGTWKAKGPTGPALA